MKKYITTYSFFLFFLGFSSLALLHGQEKQLQKAAESYENLNYVNAQKVYLAVAEKGYQSEELFTKLGNSYYFNAQYDEAVKWYQSLFDLNAAPDEGIVYLRFSQALKAVGESAKSEKYYNAYVVKNGVQSSLRTTIDYKKLIEQNSGRYQMGAIDKLFDDKNISFGHFKLGSTLYFTSTSDSKSFSNKRSAWDGLSFLSLYTVELDPLNNATANPEKLKKNLESKFHESSPVLTADGNTIYFTRSNVTSKTKKDNQKLKIYRSRRVNGKWQEAIELSINSDHFSSAHPALNANETKLYFSSDRPGGFGESDLYVSNINTDGSIGKPENLGKTINTPGKETFPFVSPQNELYFSSDGHYGLGGLDVFYVKIKYDGYGHLMNVGEPINSYADDFAFGIDFKTNRGFISSNRSSKKGQFVYDNIYSFLETLPIIDVYASMIEGTVTDKQTGLPLKNASVVLTDSENKLFKEANTDESGRYRMAANKFESYFVRASLEKYDADEALTQSGLSNHLINFQLQLNEVALVPGTDLAKVLNIPIIYFDFDKSDIRKDAQVELEKLLAALNQYPNLKIEIRAHTDSRGNDNYNKGLSQRRATSTLNYLVENGIDGTRLSAVGLGETELVNNCGNDVDCPEEEHQKNRRSEFIVKE